MTSQLTAFAVAALVLVAIPGPNHVYILTRSAGQGWRAGVASALGVEAGTLVHIALTVVGVAALIAASPALFTALKYAGVAYLIYLAARALRRSSSPAASALPARSLWRVFRDGVVVNLLNPKVALFFLAFLPQFVTQGTDPAAARAQMLAFGVILLLLGLLSDMVYAVAGGAAAAWLRRRPGAGATSPPRGRSYLVGVVYLGLATYAALGSA